MRRPRRAGRSGLPTLLVGLAGSILAELLRLAGPFAEGNGPSNWRECAGSTIYAVTGAAVLLYIPWDAPHVPLEVALAGAAIPAVFPAAAHAVGSIKERAEEWRQRQAAPAPPQVEWRPGPAARPASSLARSVSVAMSAEPATAAASDLTSASAQPLTPREAEILKVLLLRSGQVAADQAASLSPRELERDITRVLRDEIGPLEGRSFLDYMTSRF